MKLSSRFLSYLRTLFENNNPNTHPQQLAVWNQLNRRKNFRIHYPHLGPIAGLPQVYYDNVELNIKNISTGGLLIIDDLSIFGNTIGKNYKLRLSWSDYTTEILCQIVGAQMIRRHVQFMEFDPILYKRISKLVKPAFLGSKFRKVNITSETDVSELWVGQADSSLHFCETNNGYEMNLLLEGKTYRYRQFGTWTDEKEKPVDIELLAYILMTLSNIPDPSQLLRYLIEQSASLLNPDWAQKKTGTHGTT